MIIPQLTPPASPALDVAQRFAPDFQAIGATASPTNIDEVTLSFDRPSSAATARILLNDAVEGVRFLVLPDIADGGPSTDTPAGYTLKDAADMAALLPGVTDASVVSGSGDTHLWIAADTAEQLAHVRTLVRDTVLGAPVEFELSGLQK